MAGNGESGKDAGVGRWMALRCQSLRTERPLKQTSPTSSKSARFQAMKNIHLRLRRLCPQSRSFRIRMVFSPIRWLSDIGEVNANLALIVGASPLAGPVQHNADLGMEGRQGINERGATLAGHLAHGSLESCRASPKWSLRQDRLEGCRRSGDALG